MQLAILVNYAYVLLILGGLSAAAWFFEKLGEKIPIIGPLVEGSIKLIAIFGFIIGILSIIAAYYAVVTSHYDRFTIVLLAVIGVTLGIAPITKFPIAELFSVIAGISIVMLVVSFVPPAVWDWLYTSFGIKTWIILLAIFVIVAVFAYTFTKPITGLVKLIGEILTSKPVSIIIGVVAVVQGIMLFFGTSLWVYIVPYL
nr:hypothetical protein [Candidatus Baldrarchaeota archaeon]